MRSFSVLLLGIGFCLSMSATSTAKLPNASRLLQVVHRKISPESKQPPGKEASTAVDKRAVANAEAAVNKSVQAIQRRVEKEEKALERRLNEFNQLRSKALEKGDEKRLQQIERMEQAAIKSYEQRLERILAATANIKATSSKPVPNRKRQSAAQRKPDSRPTPTPPPQRRLRLWPFGR